MNKQKPEMKTYKVYLVGVWDGYKNVEYSRGRDERQAELSYAEALDKFKGKRVLLVEQIYNELQHLIEERVLLRSR